MMNCPLQRGPPSSCGSQSVYSVSNLSPSDVTTAWGGSPHSGSVANFFASNSGKRDLYSDRPNLWTSPDFDRNSKNEVEIVVPPACSSTTTQTAPSRKFTAATNTSVWSSSVCA